MRQGQGPPTKKRPSREFWSALERAKPAIVSALESFGVMGVEYVVGFIHPYSIHVWLVMTTDAERDRYRAAADPFLENVRGVIRDSGLPSEEGSIDGTVVQSQETVNRDYEGSWFYASR